MVRIDDLDGAPVDGKGTRAGVWRSLESRKGK